MGGEEAQEPLLQVIVDEAEYASNQSTITRAKKYKWWIRIAIYIILLLLGQSVATLLGRQYHDKGGKSIWMASLVGLAGFPVLLPYYFVSQTENPNRGIVQTKPPSPLVLASVYLSLGLLVSAYCYLYSIGLQYIPVSTYSLICASQLGFNAIFSFFLNSEKFTPLVINSLVFLSLSSALLMFENDSTDPTNISKGKYAVGCICTLTASAGYSLGLSLTQLSFKKVIKKETFSVVMDMAIYPSLVATCAALVGFFVSGDWKSIKREMEEYELGELSYVMNLVWTMIFWQVFSIGEVGLILEVSSLFSNAVSAVGLPIIPVLAVILFHEKMDGIKITALVLAIWGFVSYIYQQYLDDCESKTDNGKGNEFPEVSING